MIKKYGVKVTNQAQKQMREIAHYVAAKLKAPDAALRLIDDLEKVIDSLSILPHRVGFIDEEPWRSEGIRKIPVKNFLIYFWIDEKESIVQIIAVIYNKREQKQQLSKIEKE